MKLLTRVGVLGTLVALAACDTSGVATPEIEDSGLTDALAQVTADATLEDLDAMNDVVGAAQAPAGAPAAVGMLGRRNDLVRERSVSFYDETGGEQGAYDALLTASIHSLLAMSGEIERPGFSASMSRTREMWVTGLLGEETTRTFNGTGTESHERTRFQDDRGLRSFDMEATATITDVVRAVDREAQPWPLSGSITRHWQVVIGHDARGEIVRSRTVTVVFDGTQFALMTVDGETFEIDLAAGPDDRPSRRRGG